MGLVEWLIDFVIVVNIVDERVKFLYLILEMFLLVKKKIRERKREEEESGREREFFVFGVVKNKWGRERGCYLVVIFKIIFYNLVYCFFLLNVFNVF